MKSSIVLTDEIRQQIVASIRAGGYPTIAAQAWGVPRGLFKRWLQKGRRLRAREPYRSFYRQVEQARGQARLKAELATLEKDPRFWLKHGPGREQPQTPGWSAMVKACAETGTPALDLFSSPEFLQLIAAIRAALASHPEALAAVSNALTQSEKTC